MDLKVYHGKDYSSDMIRIMSYNVHYFTNIENKPIIKSIVDTILKYNPHIICLQEIALGNIKYYNTPDLKITFVNEFDKLLNFYQVLGVCSSPPGYFMTLYGNMILINKKFLANIKNINDPKYSAMINEIMCNISAPTDDNCFMNQQIFNYKNIPPKLFYDDGDYKIKYQEQNNENKCFIKIILPYFDIICVHLDAYYTKYRIEQLDQINSEITRPTIIIGDFNFFNINDFIYWRNMIMRGIYVYLSLYSESDDPIMVTIKKIIQDNMFKETGIKKLITDDMLLEHVEAKFYIPKNLDKIFKYMHEQLNWYTYCLLTTFIRDIPMFDYQKLSMTTDKIIKSMYEKIVEINENIDSLEKYFKEKSGSIFLNKEFEHCTKTLKWQTCNPYQTINISQWSGTRVDMVFFANFKKNDISCEYNLVMLPIREGSDHCPLILDLDLKNILMDTLLKDTLKIS